MDGVNTNRGWENSDRGGSTHTYGRGKWELTWPNENGSHIKGGGNAIRQSESDVGAEWVTTGLNSIQTYQGNSHKKHALTG